MRIERDDGRDGPPHEVEQRPAILAIGTALPPYQVDQETLGQWMAAIFSDRPPLARLVHKLHAHSGIQTRYSCLPDYLLPATESAYAPGQSSNPSPTTGERMAIFARESVPVGAAAARRALATFAQQRGLQSAEAAQLITQVVAVTCTGFFAPGLDFALTQELGLSPAVNRTSIGFMGCAAMFNALRVACQAVEADPEACVLVVSVELCSLHSQPQSEERDLLVAASLFGDGASACIVGRPTAKTKEYFRLDQFHSMIKPNTGDEMVWTIGDHGFQLHLSPRIPDHLIEAAPQTLQQLFGTERPAFWAIHPGGRAILDRLAQLFALDGTQMRPSRAVLRRVGNLSSATLLFVLDEVRKQFAAGARAQNGNGHGPPAAEGCQGVAMAFGPGLVIEMARLHYVAKHAAPQPMHAASVPNEAVARP